MNPFASLIDTPRDLPCRPERKAHAAPAPRKERKPSTWPWPRRNGTPIPNPWGLSWLQCEVAKRLSTNSTDAIGRELGIATKTVETNIYRARDKMGVQGRNQVARLWDSHFGEQANV